MPSSHRFKTRNFAQSVRCAWAGCRQLWRDERNIRIQVTLALAAVAAGAALHLSRVEWMLLILCITLMLSVEILNSAVERVCDREGGEYNEAIRCIKDVSAAACLLTSVGTGIVGLLLFMPHLQKFF